MKTIDRRYTKGSQNALNVANEIIAKMKAKEKINLTEIQVNNGYNLKSARSQKALQTKTFKNAIEPVIAQMERIHRKAIANLESRDYTKERIDSIVNLSKQMIHDTQLLQGKSTENTGVNVIVYGNNDLLARQLSDSKVVDSIVSSPPKSVNDSELLNT